MINNNFLQEGISPSYFFQYVDTLTNLNLHSLVIYKDNKLLSKVHIAPYNEHEKTKFLFFCDANPLQQLP